MRVLGRHETNDSGDAAERAAPTGRNPTIRATHPMSAIVILAARALGGSMTGRWWRRFVREMLQPYRPELHYMRGPGPRWRARHQSWRAFDVRIVPTGQEQLSPMAARHEAANPSR